ncbi:MAG: hypothetical protein IJ719_03800 [Clostridia bacterium]|nr:hypothetical protein [Clostridia bacterium]
MAKKSKKTKKAKRRQRGRQVGIIVLLVILALAIFAFIYFVVPLLIPQQTTVIPQQSLNGNMYRGTLVVARAETVRETESNTTIEFVAAEGSHLNRSDIICRVYSSGYNQTEINRLRAYREQIQSYHMAQVFSSYVDAALENTNSTISELAGQVRILVQGKAEGSLANLERQITSELNARKSYLKAKYPDDQTLSELYKVENDQLKKIESWTTTYSATEECLVSFYTDGYESTINSNTYAQLGPAEVRDVIRGILPEQSMVARGNKSIYRTVDPSGWYALFLCQDKDWNPTIGDDCRIVLEGFDDYPVTGHLESFTRIGNDLLLRLRVSQDVTNVLNIRTCAAQVGNFTQGYYLPQSVLYEPGDGKRYVIVLDGDKQVAVEVYVTPADGNQVFVRPVESGSPLDQGKPVQILQ